MGATDRWDTDAIENETAWQDRERAREDALARVAEFRAASDLPLTPHPPTPEELADVFRPLAPSPTKERDRRIAALTRVHERLRFETTNAQGSARLLTRSAHADPATYDDVAREARSRALTLVRYRDAIRQQLTALMKGGPA